MVIIFRPTAEVHPISPGSHLQLFISTSQTNHLVRELLDVLPYSIRGVSCWVNCYKQRLDIWELLDLS